jgi:uncharacterized membrane protein YecN with MAPEG domain
MDPGAQKPPNLTGDSRVFTIEGISFLVSRIAHAVGLKHDNMTHPGRLIGMIGTVGVTIVAAGYSLWLYAEPMLS